MAQRYPVDGKVALITGAARGIGLETARALQARGAKVVIVDLAAHDPAGVAAELGGDAIGVVADVTDSGAMQQAVATTVERFGGLDVVVANAGIGSRGATAAAMSGEAFERVLDVNAFGVWRTVQAALPEITRRGGHVVLVASIYAFSNGLGASPYAMSKAAVESLGRALRVELAQHGASATTAYFGYIDTQLVRSMIDADPAVERMERTIPSVLRKRLPPKAAGEGIARAIEGRRPRLILPRRWILMSVLRGIINPLIDARMVKDARIQAIARELDARGGDEQPTSA